MPKPRPNKMLKKVLSHLKGDIKEESREAREDKELISSIKNKLSGSNRKMMRSGKKKKK